MPSNNALLYRILLNQDLREDLSLDKNFLINYFRRSGKLVFKKDGDCSSVQVSDRILINFSRPLPFAERIVMEVCGK